MILAVSASAPVFAEENDAVIIQRGKIPIVDVAKDFEVVSGSEEVIGDPEPGRKAGYASWKAACAEWKKELKELNKTNQVLTLNCNSPEFVQENGNYTYKSQGSYKLRVRVRGQGAYPTVKE